MRLFPSIDRIVHLLKLESGKGGGGGSRFTAAQRPADKKGGFTIHVFIYIKGSTELYHVPAVWVDP